MAVPFKNRIQRFIRVDAYNMFSVNAFKIALRRGLKLLLPTLDASYFPTQILKSKSVFGIAAGDETTPATVISNVVSYIAPQDMTITDISASLTTPQTSGSLFTADVKKNGTSLISTNKLVFDNTEYSTITSSVQPSLTTTTLTKGDLLSIDVTQVGDGTATGLKIYLTVEI